MEQLVQAMRKVLANSFVFYTKALNFHWNVEGDDFPQYHEFFGKLYSEVYGSIDSTAEEIRALGEYAPGSLKRFIELSDLQEDVAVPSLDDMLVALYRDNSILINSLNQAFVEAEKQNEQGLMDYLAGRIDSHKKHAWMLRSCIRED
jgi:starvation-inducible DNA-binding protein